jgi:membrane protein YqaA with SNARE-associated domain
VLLEYLSNPQLWLLIVVLSLVGSFARLPNYYGGLRGKEAIETFYPRIKPETWERVLDWYRRLGPLPLLIASIPFIGTVLTIGAGMASIRRIYFLIFVFLSKVVRNWLLVLIIARVI